MEFGFMVKPTNVGYIFQVCYTNYFLLVLVSLVTLFKWGIVISCGLMLKYDLSNDGLYH